MKKNLLQSYCLAICTLLTMASVNTQGQSTFEDVLTIFENNGCSSSSCHGGGSAGLTLNNNVNISYSNLIGISPENMLALEKGDQLVTPGYPERSFLYRKINDHLYTDSDLDTGEGGLMPPSGVTMSNVDKETIRQWILFGAPKNGKAFTDVTKDAFTEYHTDGGIGPLDAPPAPAEDEGFQIHFGSIFLAPGQEIEYVKKHDLKLEEGLEVNRVELFMNDFSHHFILYKLNGNGSNVEEGLQIENGNAITGNMITAWQDNFDFRLPEGTAYVWDESTILNLNYHILNYDQAAPLAADLYLNVYTQPAGTAEKEMFSDLLINGNIFIPAGQEATFTDEVDIPTSINVWNLSSHTHKYGKDFDIYLREPNGSKGLQLFEGQYNTAYTEFAGFYDYAHPPIRFFDNFLEVNAQNGLIQEATFDNTGDEAVFFGLTTDDEMMITFMQYTLGDNHQEEATFHEINSTYCLSSEPFEVLSNFETGVIGNGLTHNTFDPSKAGVGSHVLYANCCDPSEMTEIIIEVVPDLVAEDLSVDAATNEIGWVELTANFAGIDDVTYQWFLDDTAIEGATTANYETEFNGMYSVELDNGVCKTITEVEVTEATTTSIGMVNLYQFSAAPNPFAEQTRINFSLNQNSEVQAQVFDLAGKQVALLTDATLSVGTHSFDFSAQQAGVYLLQLTIDGQSFTQKLIKQ